MVHCAYSLWHLSRPASGKTPGSSASYMIFASGIDLCSLPCYVYAALIGAEQHKLSAKGLNQDHEWTSLLPNGQADTPILSATVFLISVIIGGLHLVTLGVSAYLAATYRAITRLPPDMNPLEDNLTSRHSIKHKRNKSSMSASMASLHVGRMSDEMAMKLHSNRSYTDSTMPPTVPFLHTRTGSGNSLPSYHSSPPTSRRGSEIDVQARQSFYDQPPSLRSSRSSTRSTRSRSRSPKRASSPLKHTSYAELPISEPDTETESNRISQHADPLHDAWFAASALSSVPNSRTSSPMRTKSPAYHPVHARRTSFDEIPAHPNPLAANPPSPRHTYTPLQLAPFANINLGDGSTDIVDSAPSPIRSSSPRQKVSENLKARFYGELRPATPEHLIGMARSESYMVVPEPNEARGVRQVSSGNDFVDRGREGLGRRDVSGKVAEEGRAGPGDAWDYY